MSSLETLFDALVALRDAPEPLDREHDARWRTIDAYLRSTFPARGPEADEARQETLIAITRSVRAMEAAVPLQAAKWVATIHRRKKIDGLRVRTRDPVRRGLERAHDDDAPSAVDRIEGDAGNAIDGEVIERVMATIEDHVAAHLAETEPSPIKRHLRRLQARATLRRLVLEADFEELAGALEADEPLTRERIYKWVERGRPVVLAALERWARIEGPGSLASEIAAVVHEVVAARRVDAGRARPERRRGADP